MTRAEILKQIEQCNVCYHVLGQTDRSAMPLGDGEVGVSAWVTQDGVLHCYLSRTDALTELDRTVKLGEITVSFSPAQFTPESYRQTLHLADGMMELQGKNGTVCLWVEKETHSLCVQGNFDAPVQAEAQFHTWRNAPYAPFGEFQVADAVTESADIVRRAKNTVFFCHQNGKTLLPYAAQLEGVGDVQAVLPDLLSNRIFGGKMELTEKEHGFDLRIVTHSCQNTLHAFEKTVASTLAQASTLADSKAETTRLWNKYWCNSYIFVENDAPAQAHYAPALNAYLQEPREYTCACTSAVTRAYTLTKYMNACCNEGTMPVLYNGLLFNLCPGMDEHFNTQNFGRVYTAQPAKEAQNVTPDERSWCREQLWQNVRHPYLSLLARGEGQKLRILFSYYKRFEALNRVRAQRYYQAKGQHNTEMTLSFGLQSPEIYGKDRTGVPLGYAENRWGGAVDISPGLELLTLMLDYWQYYRDNDFFEREALPYCHELLQYIETRFPLLKSGKMQIGPINSIETYRETINPTPIVAGLHSVLERVLAADAALIPERGYYKRYAEKLPPIPCNAETLLPAQEYAEKRYNVEVPELYACYPFRNYTFYKHGAELARRTYQKRTEQYQIEHCFCIGDNPSAPSCSGWQYTGVVAAMLGMTQEAARILTGNCALQNPGTRFPAMWGPIYDAVPDTDHGANILSQLQTMLLQTQGRTIYLFPAFPPAWNVRFKLYADAQTCIEGAWHSGKMDFLKVTPASRETDVIVLPGRQNNCLP